MANKSTITARDTTTLENPLLERLSTAVVRLDTRLHVIYMNQAAESLFTISVRKAKGGHCSQLHGMPTSLIDRFTESLLTGQPFSDRQVTMHPGGQEPVLIDCLISPEPIEEKPGLLIEVTTVDRHLRIAREEALLAQQEHFRSLLRGLAHEIKNPLGGLRGAAQLLERELPDASLADYTRVIIREADRLQQLIDRMLGPASRPILDSLNIHETLEHVRKIIKAEADARVVVLTDYDPSIPELNSDWDRLVQVFLNIAVNALSAVDGSGRIIFRTRVINNFTIGAVRHKLVISAQIIDNGKGIPPEILEQIFFPMVTGRSGGTGLGLSIAQQSINQLGGLIECSSEPNHTVFTVLIPLEDA